MASLKLTTEYKLNLYYTKYKYRAAIPAYQIGRIRYCKDIEQYYSRIDWLISKKFLGFNFYSKVNLILVEKLINLKNNYPQGLFTRLDINKITFYSNDLNQLTNLIQQFPNITPKFSEVIPSYSNDVMIFKTQPPTKYRTYVKSGKFSFEVKKTLIELIERNSNGLFPSKGIKRWLENDSNWIWNAHFIGYNDESLLTILALTVPDLIGKNYKLEKL